MGDNVKLKFDRLIQGPFGEISDMWAEKLISSLRKRSIELHRNNNKDFISEKLREVNTQTELIKDFIEKFKNIINNINSDNNVQIVNQYPAGKSLEDNSKKLVDFIQKIDPNERLNFYKQFKQFFIALYPEEYKNLSNSSDDADLILFNSCGSLFDYPTIDSKSIGLGSIYFFANFFRKYYDDPNINDEDFLRLFSNIMGYSDFIKNYNEKLQRGKNKFYTMDFDIWFSGGDGLTVKNDSYCEVIQYTKLKENDGSGTTDITNINQSYGYFTYNRNNTYLEIDANNNSTVMFLFRNGYRVRTTDNSIYDISNINLGYTPNEISDIHYFLYNFIYSRNNNQAIVQNINPDTQFSDVNNITDTNNKQNKLFVRLQQGGKLKKIQKKVKKVKKIKMKGGNRGNLLELPDNNTNNEDKSYLHSSRTEKDFNKENFKKIIAKYFEESKQDRYSEKILSTIGKLSQLPLFYHSKNDKRTIDTKEISFNDMRSIFLFFNVLHTQYTFILNFLEKYSECLEILKNKPESLKNEILKKIGNNNLNSNLYSAYDFTTHFDNIKKGIEKLKTKIEKFINSLKKLTLNETEPISVKNLFLGFDVPDADKIDYFKENLIFDANGDVIIVKLINFILRYSVTNLNDSNNSTLGKFNNNNDYFGTLGGVPLLTTEPEFSLKIIMTYYLILTYRQKSSQNLSERISNYYNYLLSNPDEQEKMKLKEILDQRYNKNVMTRYLADNSRQYEYFVNEIYKYFYLRSIKYAEFIIGQHLLSQKEKNTKTGKKTIRELIRKKLSSDLGTYTSYQANAYKSINLFEYEIDEMIRKLIAIGKNKNIDNNKIKWMLSKLRNLVIRLQYLDETFYYTNSNKKQKLLNKVGFSFDDILRNQVPPTIENMKSILTKTYPDPRYETREFWLNCLYKFNKYSRNVNSSTFTKKLYVLAIRTQSKNYPKLTLSNVYLIDIFGATINEFGADNIQNDILTEDDDDTIYSPDNAVITLLNYSNFLKTVLSRGKKANKFLEEGLKKRTNSEKRLPHLKAYSPKSEKQEFDKNRLKQLQPLILFGKNDRQLIENLHNLGSRPEQKNKIIIYKITDSEIVDPIKMRKWCYNLLFSLPKEFGKSNSDYDEYVTTVDKISIEGKYSFLPFSRKNIIAEYYNALWTGSGTELQKTMRSKENTFKSIRKGNFVSQESIQNMGLIELF